jgi:DNA helicase-2/ATP-dependent DNA helicase PcrA
MDNLGELVNAAKEFEKDNPDLALEDFLTNIALVSDIDSLEQGQGIVMMTVHSAKGLEFPVVFLVGMEDGLFPISKALDDPAGMEEERRLCYVGITRAKSILYVTYARTRNTYGRVVVNVPSRFIKEIGIAPQHKVYDKSDLRAKREETKPKPKGDYRVGMKVLHRMWGSGMIVQVKDMGNDRELSIVFNSVGLKKLSANIAPLKIEEGENG